MERLRNIGLVEINMLNKKAYSVQMSFNVPDSEKRIAEKAEENFEDLLSKLKIAVEYLDFIYDPFKKYLNVNNEELVRHRSTFRQYRDEVISKFDAIFRRAHKCVILMSEFNTDTATEEIMKSFIDSIKELEKYINIFISVFFSLSDSNFRNDLISSIDAIKKQINQLKQLINDRVLDHIQSNILAKNWASDLSKEIQEKVNSKLPLIVELFRERQKALKDLS